MKGSDDVNVTRSLIRNETGLTRLVLAVALLGLAVIGGWAWFAVGALPPTVVVLATVGLAATYASLLVALAVTSVRRASRSREGVVLEMRRHAETGKRLAIYDPATGLFHRWYFELRLDGEIKRCQRYGLTMAVLVVRAEPPDLEPDFGTWKELNSNLALLVARTVRTVDIPASVGELEYAMCLPQCNRTSAEATAERLVNVLSNYSATAGLALYPGDGSEGKALLELARQRAQPAQRARSA